MAGKNPIDLGQMENAILNAIKNSATTRDELYLHLYQIAKIHASIAIYDRHINFLIDEGKIHTRKVDKNKRRLYSRARHILSIPKRRR
ncbi:hypothetical protein IIC68_02290 [archaeon]|nr:hypothetical protein [archaeon]